VTGGPRSEKKRGPRGTDAGGPAAGGARRRTLPDGGYDAASSNRHLISYHEKFGDGSESDEFYNATRAIVVSARRWRKLANERVKAVGQTMARWETLFLVAFADVELTQSELARLISVEGPTMVRMLDVLARDGLIERSQSETDRRVTINRITPAGLQVISQIMGITNNLRRELLTDIDPDRLAICVDVLNQILGKLDELK
jgi:DNA-binding MarR family transcriptional regulator